EGRVPVVSRGHRDHRPVRSIPGGQRIPGGNSVDRAARADQGVESTMTTLIGKAAAACIVTAGLAATATTQGASKPAPDVALQRADGATVHVSDYKGKVLLVDFWASWCGPCKASFPALDTLYREYESRGFEVLAVDVDERRADGDAFLANHPHR